MRINIGDFGMRTGELAPDPNVGAASFVTGIDGQIGSIVNEAQSFLAEQKKLADAESRAKAAANLELLKNDLHDTHDTMSRAIFDGSVPREKAMQDWQKQSTKLVSDRIKDMDQQQRDVITPHVVNVVGTLGRSLEGAVHKRGQEELRGTIGKLGEEVEREAFRTGDPATAVEKYRTAIASMGPTAGMTPGQIAADLNKRSEAIYFNHANRDLEDAAQTGDLAAIRAARERIQDKKFDPIDPARRNVLISRAWAYENGILTQAARDADRVQRERDARERDAVDAQRELFDYLSKGSYPSADYVKRVTDRTAGTAMEVDVRDMLKNGGETARFASLSLPQQAADLERQRAALADPKVGGTPANQKIIEQLEKVYQSGVKDVDENPWKAAQARGVIRDAPVINITNVGDAQAIIGERMKQIGQLEEWTGRKVSPMQPEEAKSIGKIVRALPIAQQATALAEFGQSFGNQERLDAFAKQIHDQDHSLGLAMGFATSQTMKGRYIAELVLKGDQAIKDKLVKPDAMVEAGWRAKIAKEIRGAYASKDVEDRLIDSAFLIQAAISSAGGGDLGRSDAVELATGGIKQQRDGTRIPLPFGIKADDFDKRVKALTPADLAAQAPDGMVMVGKTQVPLADFVKQLPDASLRHAGQGLYVVRAGLGVVTNSKGQRITLDFNHAR